jgi:hypothetical protein
MSRLADAYARVSPRLAGRRGAALPTRVHAWLLWPRFVAVYRGYDHYLSIATRELPVVVLEPRG